MNHAEPPSVVSRTLSRTQAATRRRLIEAAVELADEGGYEAVNMREVAARAGVSPATAYQYFGSKDHVLVDSLLELAEQSAEAVNRRRSRNGSPAEVLVSLFRRIIREAEAHPHRYEAMFRAYVSGSPSMRHADTAESLWPRPSWIQAVLAEVDLPDRDQRVQTLTHVFLGGMVTIASGGEPRKVGQQLEDATRLLLSP